VAACAAALVVPAVVAVLALAVLTPGRAAEVDRTPADGATDILGVHGGDDGVQALFAAPAELAAETLTADDVTVRVDGEPHQVQLRRLAATAVEIAVVVDTAVPIEELRDMQSAVAELAFDLPQDATARIVDATGAASEPSDGPAAAIAEIGRLRPETTDDLQGAVDRSVQLLDRSTQERTALVVVGRDLDSRLRPIAEQPFRRTVHVITVDADQGVDQQPLLGPRSSGTVRAVGDVTGVRPAVDEVGQDLRATYQAEVVAPSVRLEDGQTLTVEVPTASGEAAAATVTIADGGITHETAGLAASGDGGDATAAADDEVRVEDRAAIAAAAGDDAPVSQPLASVADRLARSARPLAMAVIALVVLVAVGLAARRLWYMVDRAPLLYRSRQWARAMMTPPVRRRRRPPPEPAEEPVAAASGTRRPRGPSTHPARPIAKLSDETHEALAQAHLSLRRLALASRRAADTVPDDLFRLAEAQASVALSGPTVDTVDVVTAALPAAESSEDAQRVRRAAQALETGWQQTARRASGTAAVSQIGAAVTGIAPNGSHPAPQRPAAPVRALNPLVQVGLDHIALAGRSGRDSAVIARAVTAVDIMRAARLARPVLIVSPGLLSNRHRYGAALDSDLVDPGQRDAWLGLLCESITRGAADSADRIGRLTRLRTRHREQARDSRALPLVDLLLACPVIDFDMVTDRLTVPPDAAEHMVRTVVDAGILTRHDRVADAWVAPEVLAVFAEAAAPHAHSTR
jgi:hypothetical protein